MCAESLTLSAACPYFGRYVHAASGLLGAGQIDDARVFAKLSLDANPKLPLYAFQHSIIQAAAGQLKAAAFELAGLLTSSPKHAPARDALNRIQCARLEADAIAPARGGAVGGAADTLTDYHSESLDLKERLQAIKALLSRRALKGENSQEDELWQELEEDENRLDKLLAMQKNAAQLKTQLQSLGEEPKAVLGLVSAAKASARGRRMLPATTRMEPVSVASLDGGNEEDGDNPRVVVVEYPKSPSIPSLIAAVAEMFAKRTTDGADDTEPSKRLAFEVEGWPTEDDCAGVQDTPARFMSTWMSVAAKYVEVRDHIDVESELESRPEDFLPPICDAPLATKKVHTLEHLEGISKRDKLAMLPEHALREVIRRVHEPRKKKGDAHVVLAPLPIDEVGERTRLALLKNSTSWVSLNIAALYWRVEGNATQAIECLRRAFLYSSSPNKDVALVSIANVLHLSGFTIDAVTMMQMAIQVAPKMALNHFTMANILFALGEQSSLQAAFFYEATLRFQSEFSPALSRLLRLRCLAKSESLKKAALDVSGGAVSSEPRSPAAQP